MFVKLVYSRLKTVRRAAGGGGGQARTGRHTHRTRRPGPSKTALKQRDGTDVPQHRPEQRPKHTRVGPGSTAREPVNRPGSHAAQKQPTQGPVKVNQPGPHAARTSTPRHPEPAISAKRKRPVLLLYGCTCTVQYYEYTIQSYSYSCRAAPLLVPVHARIILLVCVEFGPGSVSVE